MSNIIWLVIGIIVGIVIDRNWKKQGTGNSAPSNPTNEQRAQEHQAHLDKILASFNSGDEITNDKVQSLLGVSDTTTGRYLDELEKAGKIRQVGTTGKYVIYRKI